MTLAAVAQHKWDQMGDCSETAHMSYGCQCHSYIVVTVTIVINDHCHFYIHAHKDRNMAVLCKHDIYIAA